jgi:hypothetical protein
MVRLRVSKQDRRPGTADRPGGCGVNAIKKFMASLFDIFHSAPEVRWIAPDPWRATLEIRAWAVYCRLAATFRQPLIPKGPVECDRSRP